MQDAWTAFSAYSLIQEVFSDIIAKDFPLFI